VELQRRQDVHIHVGVRRLERLWQESDGLVQRTDEGLENIRVLGNQYKVPCLVEIMAHRRYTK
jgi:hypothetical protein